MSKETENQPLLNMASTTPTLTPTTSTPTSIPAQQYIKQKPKWQSYKHPEIKHELILYAELAAAAAFIVGLYVLCLLPWEYICRAEMLSSRLHPSEISVQHVQNLRDSCDINDDINYTIAYKLTKRPCGTKPMPTRTAILDIKHGAKCNEDVKDEDKFKLGKAKIRYSLDTPRYSYHDINEFFRIVCCSKTALSCPCGYDHSHQNKCYTFLLKDKPLECPFKNNFNQTQVTSLMPLLISQNLKYYCNEGEKYNLNGSKMSTCDSNNITYFSTENNTQYYLCESNFINKTEEWWRKD